MPKSGYLRYNEFIIFEVTNSRFSIFGKRLPIALFTCKNTDVTKSVHCSINLANYLDKFWDSLEYVHINLLEQYAAP